MNRFPQLRLGLVDLPVPKPLGPGSIFFAEIDLLNRESPRNPSKIHPKSIQNGSHIPKNIIRVCLKMLCTPKPNGFADHYPVFKWLAIIGNINPTFSDKPIKQLIFPGVFRDFGGKSSCRDPLLLHRGLTKDGGYILIHGLLRVMLRHLKQCHGWSNHVPTIENIWRYGILNDFNIIT